MSWWGGDRGFANTGSSSLSGMMNDLNPLWMLKYLPNMSACQIGIAFDARGPNNSITHADISSMEAIAIRDTLGRTPVTALKSYFGNTGAGSGAMELLGSLLAFEHGEVPATLNYETPDEDCPVHVVHGAALPVEKQTAVVLSQAMMGQAATIVLHGPAEM